MRCNVLFLSVALFANLGFAKIQVVATLPVLGDIAKKVGGDFVDVSSLAEPNRDPHRIEPKPTLIRQAMNADVFIENGMSLELWAKNVLTSAANTKIQPGQSGHVVASKDILPLEKPTEVSRSQGDVHPDGNPHVWLDPVRAKTIAKNIHVALVIADPDHKVDFERLLKQFETDIDSRMVAWEAKAASLKGKKFITYHKTFAYLADRFKFVVAAEIEEKPGIAPGPQYKARLIEIAKNEKVSAIVQEIYYEDAAAKYIGAQTKIRVVEVPIDVGADSKANDYFSLIDFLIDSFLGKD